MNEKTEQILKLLQANIDRIVIAVMYILVGVMVYFWWVEQNPAEATTGEQKLAVLKDPVAENSNYKMIAEYTRNPDISAFPQIDQVAKFNMFEYKSVKQREALEREVRSKVDSAEKAMSEGRTEDARRLLREVLDVFPAHQRARELMNKLTSGERGTAAKTAATTTPR
jgi:predicted negative regulator of RcsB-dependent stress response